MFLLYLMSYHEPFLAAEEIQELWQEYETNSSLEANLVKDFDKVCNTACLFDSNKIVIFQSHPDLEISQTHLIAFQHFFYQLAFNILIFFLLLLRFTSSYYYASCLTCDIFYKCCEHVHQCYQLSRNLACPCFVYLYSLNSHLFY